MKTQKRTEIYLWDSRGYCIDEVVLNCGLQEAKKAAKKIKTENNKVYSWSLIERDERGFQTAKYNW